MNIYYIIVITAIFLAFSVRLKIKYGLEIAFVILTAFVGLRYEYFGVDTYSYMDRYLRLSKLNINPFNIVDIYNSEPNIEIGWVLLNYWLKFLGWPCFQLFLSVIENFILYKIIKEYVPPTYYWLSIFILGFNKSFLLIGECSMVRQWLAISIVVFAFKYIVNKKIIKYTACMILAYLIHRTAIIALPAYLLVYVDKLKFTWKTISILCVCLYIWFSVALDYTFYIDMFIASSEDYEKYGVWQGDMRQHSFSLYGLALTFLIPLLSFWGFKEFPKYIKYSCFMCCIGLLFIALDGYSTIIGRLGLYFSIFSIVLFPCVIHSIERRFPKSFLHIFLMLLLVFGYVKEFTDTLKIDVWYSAFNTYKTLL